MDWTITAIAQIETDFTDKFGIPRQSGLVPELTARIVFAPAFRDPNALNGIEQFSHLWLIWQFSDVAAQNKPWRPTVRPPRLGGNTRLGVFATRSPYRPNAMGLSCVELAGVDRAAPDGPVLLVRGADLKNGTPIFDIKPYLPYTDCRPAARGGFAEQHKTDGLRVEFPPALLERVPPDKRAALCGVLAGDPRPAYQNDPDRMYALDFAGLTVRFRAADGAAQVVDVQPAAPGTAALGGVVPLL